MKTPIQTPRSRRALFAAAALVTMTLGAAGGALAMPGGHGPHGPGMRGGGMMDGPGFGRMLEGINATPEQKAQIEQIWRTARGELRTQRETGAKLREQMQQLFAQPSVDARAVEALRQQMLAQHDAVSKRTTQAMLDASRVLSAEQRKVLAERMSQRRAMAQRHRGEREAQEGARN
ncbi:MAG: Spy/CpxP family protein refolding chaperone [Pseudomonadota bacterium]